MASSITDNLGQPAEVTGPGEAINPSDIQRSALRDLVKLAADCAHRERHIEERYEASVSGSRQEFERVSHELEERQAAARGQIEQQYADAVRQLHEQFQSAVGAVRESERSAKSRLTQEKGTIERQLKQKFTQATWLADSVLEAAQIHIQEAYRKALEDNAAHAAEAASLENQAQHLLYSLGYALPEGEPGGEEIPPEQASETFRSARQSAEETLDRLASLRLPRLLVGVTPFLLGLLLCAVAGGVTQAACQTREPQWQALGISVGATAAACIVVGILLGRKARAQVAELAISARGSIDRAAAAAQAERQHFDNTREYNLTKAQQKREQEIKTAREQYQPLLEKTTAELKAAIAAVDQERDTRLPKLDEKKQRAQAEADAWRARALEEFETTSAAERQSLREKLDAHLARLEEQHAADLQHLEQQWRDGLKALDQSIARTAGSEGPTLTGWQPEQWRDWKPPQQFPHAVRFGSLHVDLTEITKEYPRRLQMPRTFSMPALLAFPRHASLMLHTDGPGRTAALQTLQTVMLRLLTCVPPGRVRFTIIDPIGLGQNFAGFMHLADYDEALVGSRIWTEAEHIERRLADLTEHMETVIQKYLRNEFETIDDYNAQAGELAEPYRFLVIADLPASFTDESLQRLSSIATTGARCGVYTLILRDTRQAITNKAMLDNLMLHSVNLVERKAAPAGPRGRSNDGHAPPPVVAAPAESSGVYEWKDEVFRRFPLVLDPPPSEEFLTQILQRIGTAAREAKRVEVAFRTIAPPDGQIWSGSTASELTVAIGRMGATRLQTLRLGRGVAQHALIAGKTGSGKSTLLHVLITNLALWYSPDEVEFYLVDFKKGVEFKAYVTYGLPHARAIAVESDREFGLSVLQRVDAELARRGALFRDAGVQELAAYRHLPGTEAMPRTLLIIDEFQEFFSEDDRIAQDAGLLLDRLVRQGRAFGIHVLLGSQTIGGTSGLARSTLGQMAVRIALQTSEADSQMILGDNNVAARLLSRPGEAIYNDAGGLVEANSPFQVAWLPDEERERQLERVKVENRKSKVETGLREGGPPLAIVFEGNVPADIRQNLALQRAIESAPGASAVIPDAPRIWLGDPVAIKEPTQVVLRRQSGANVLIVGQQEEPALALLCSAIASLAVQFPRQGLAFHVLDGTPADSALVGTFERLRSVLPVQMTLVEYRAVPQAMNELVAELQRRQDSGETRPPGVFLLIHSLQRYRALRRQDDGFSFSGDSDAAPQPDRQFATLLRDGPPLGMHVIASIDTVASLERTVDRASVREFDNRILFQMSANDSSTLIDSPLANKLGMNRALAYSEEQGVVEKFRPYAMPPGEWLEQINVLLRATPGS